MQEGSAQTILPRRLGYRTVPMEVLCLSMGRSGTTSTTAALEILGHKHVYHGWTVFDDHDGRRRFIEGLRAKFLGRGKPLKTRNDFDWVFGQYSATGGDIPSVAFADELIAAYPEAKVLLVERDTDSWVRSLPDAVTPAFRFVNIWVLATLDPRFFGEITAFFSTGFRGVFNATSLQEIDQNAAETYRTYNQHIREITPKERLLDFKLQDGWGPLCEFLGKPVPEQSFPRLNEKGMVAKRERGYQFQTLGNIGKNLTSVGVLVIGVWWLYSSSSLYGSARL